MAWPAAEDHPAQRDVVARVALAQHLQRVGDYLDVVGAVRHVGDIERLSGHRRQEAPLTPAPRGSAPGERRVARGMQFAAAVPGEPERRQEPLFLAEQFLRYERPDTDHLVSVIGVGDDIRVLAENIEYREAVRGEGADPARRLVPVKLALAVEARVAGLNRPPPHPDELPTHRDLAPFRPVRTHGALPAALPYELPTPAP